MDTLNQDIFNLIHYTYIGAITDVRTLSRVNTSYYVFFVNRIGELKDIYWKKYRSLSFSYELEKTSILKFTIELILDGYYHLIPDRYYNPDNVIMCPMLAFAGNLEKLLFAVD